MSHSAESTDPGGVMIWLILAACTGSEPNETGAADSDTVDPAAWAVDEPGPYRTGHRSWELTFASNIDGGDRTITVHAWYPTEATEGDDVSYLGIYSDEISLGNAEAAPPAHADGYPVHLYSHGNTMFGGDASHLMRLFASHGWVSLAPDHTDNLLTDSVDGSIPTSVYIHRPQDLVETLDLIEGLDPSDPLSAAVTDSVLVNGHSRGCDDVWMTMGASIDPDSLAEACTRMDQGSCSEEELAAFLSGDVSDQRMAAGITMAGTINRSYHSDEGHLSVRGPVLLMSGSNDSGHAVSESFDSLEGIDRSLLDIEGACHGSFNMGFCETLETDLGYHIVQTYALAFGRRHLLGDDDEKVMGVLDGSVEVAAEATIQLGD